MTALQEIDRLLDLVHERETQPGRAQGDLGRRITEARDAAVAAVKTLAR